MRERPYTLLSCCVSIDGYIGNAASRLLLSNDADFDRVDAVRASCDAILVGAATVRIDNPRLLVRSQARRDERTARGLANRLHGPSSSPGSDLPKRRDTGRYNVRAKASTGTSTRATGPRASRGRCEPGGRLRRTSSPSRRPNREPPPSGPQ